MLKITLISPAQFAGYPQPPIGLATIAAVLEKEGHRVEILDANALNLAPEAAAARVTDADIVGITAMTPTISGAIAIAGEIRKNHPDIRIILGGAHATLMPEETLSSAPDIDIIVRGEGEETIIELAKMLETGGSPESIAGISCRSGGEIISTPDRTGMVDLDALPFPAYHLLQLGLYKPHPPHGLASPFAAILTSRGCPYRCAYCSKPVFGSKFRAQSPERVIAEIVYLQETLGIREIAFYDDVFTLDKERAHAIADEIIKRRIRLCWTCEARVNLVDRDLLRHMKQAGCYAIAYGIESAAPEILRTLHKDISLEQVAEAVKISREAGLQVIGYLMLGSPGETPETIRQTIGFAKKLKLDFAQFSITTPFPATELYGLYTQGREEKIPWESFVYSGKDSRMTPVFESERLCRDDLKQWTRRAYREFYLRPGYIAQRLRRMRSVNEIKINLKGFGMLLRSIMPSG